MYMADWDETNETESSMVIRFCSVFGNLHLSDKRNCIEEFTSADIRTLYWRNYTSLISALYLKFNSHLYESFAFKN